MIFNANQSDLGLHICTFFTLISQILAIDRLHEKKRRNTHATIARELDR